MVRAPPQRWAGAVPIPTLSEAMGGTARYPGSLMWAALLSLRRGSDHAPGRNSPLPPLFSLALSVGLAAVLAFWGGHASGWAGVWA